MSRVSGRISQFLLSVPERNPIIRYVASILFVGTALLITLRFTHPECSPYFSLLLAAVALSAACGGFGPGVVATCAALLGAFYLLIPPRLTFSVTHPEDAVRILLFGPTGLFISWLIGGFIATEAQLQRSEEQFRLLAGSAPVGIFQTDADGLWNFVNPTWCEISGINADDAKGIQWTNAIHPEDRERVTAQWRAAAARGGSCAAEYRYLTPDGRLRWVRGMANPVMVSGKIAGFVGTVTDITHIVAAQDALAESEASFRQLADAMPQMVWTARPDGFVDYYNRKRHEWTGVPVGWLGDESWKSLLHPDDVKQTLDQWEKSIQSGEPFEIEHRYRDLNGNYRWYLDRAVPVRDVSGRVVKWFGTSTDIDDMKRAQAHLLLAEKLASAGRLASTIAHELNNPLGAVVNLIYLARSTESLTAKDEYLRSADRELARVARLANRCLNFDAGKTVRTNVNVNDLIGDALAVFETTINSRHLNVLKRLDIVPDVLGSPDELRQVFINLLSNAIEAVAPNGNLAICAAKYKSHKTGGGGVRLLFADDGLGIAASTKIHIFDPFFTTKNETGAGLGLWITRNIIESHDGKIRIRSSVAPQRHGTVVSVHLPAILPSYAAA